MARSGMILYLKHLIIFTFCQQLVSSLTLPNQGTQKPRHTRFSSSTTEPGSGSLVTPTPSSAAKDKPDNKGVALYKYINSNSQEICILMRTDAVAEVRFNLHGIEEQADAFIPENALIDGNCKNEDSSYMRISWTGYSLELNFDKTPGGERWYISKVELTVSPELRQLHGVSTRGKPIKLYHEKMLIPTPIGRSYSCEEVEIELSTKPEDHPPKELRGSLFLRLLQVQAFMYKRDNFGPPFECKSVKQFRDETAPIAVGSTLAIAVLMTVTGYGIFRYFKIKNVQYNTME